MALKMLQLTYEGGEGPAEEGGHGREEDGQLQVSVEPGTVAEQGLDGNSTDLVDYQYQAYRYSQLEFCCCCFRPRLPQPWNLRNQFSPVS